MHRVGLNLRIIKCAHHPTSRSLITFQFRSKTATAQSDHSSTYSCRSHTRPTRGFSPLLLFRSVSSKRSRDVPPLLLPLLLLLLLAPLSVCVCVRSILRRTSASPDQVRSQSPPQSPEYSRDRTLEQRRKHPKLGSKKSRERVSVRLGIQITKCHDPSMHSAYLSKFDPQKNTSI